MKPAAKANPATKVKPTAKAQLLAKGNILPKKAASKMATPKVAPKKAFTETKTVVKKVAPKKASTQSSFLLLAKTAPTTCYQG